MFNIVENQHDDTNSNLAEAVCILYSAKTLRKGMNPNILPQQWADSRVDWILQTW